MEEIEITSAISINIETFTKEISELINKLFLKLKLPITQGDKIEKIKAILGFPISFDEIFQGITRYNYLLSNNKHFVSLGIDDFQGLNSFEIISNTKITNGILNEKWRCGILLL